MTRLQRMIALVVCMAALVAQGVQPGQSQATYPSQAPTYNTTIISATAAASKDYLNLFNDSGSGRIVRIVGIYISPANTATVTGIAAHFTYSVTSTVGTTCTAITIQPLDSQNPAVPAQITSSHTCTTDPVVTFDVGGCATDLEEARAIMNPPPCYEFQNSGGQPIVLREGQGVMVKTTALAPVGLTTVRIELTII